jgi:hypothetical protein
MILERDAWFDTDEKRRTAWAGFKGMQQRGVDLQRMLEEQQGGGSERDEYLPEPSVGTAASLGYGRSAHASDQMIRAGLVALPADAVPAGLGSGLGSTVWAGDDDVEGYSTEGRMKRRRVGEKVSTTRRDTLVAEYPERVGGAIKKEAKSTLTGEYGPGSWVGSSAAGRQAELPQDHKPEPDLQTAVALGKNADSALLPLSLSQPGGSVSDPAIAHVELGLPVTAPCGVSVKLEGPALRIISKPRTSTPRFRVNTAGLRALNEASQNRS